MLPGTHIDSIQEVVRGKLGVSPSKRNCININMLGIWKNDPLCPGKSTPIPFRGRYCGACCATESTSGGPASIGSIGAPARGDTPMFGKHDIMLVIAAAGSIMGAVAMYAAPP